MLCKYCDNFNYNQLVSPERYQHHKTWDDLLVSAEEGCQICGLVIKEFHELPIDESTQDECPVTCELLLDELGGGRGEIVFWSEDFLRARLQPLQRLVGPH